MTYIWSGGKQTAARFLINNVSNVDVGALAKLANASVINPVEMNERINAQLGLFLRELPDSANPLVIYPGNGANQLNGALPTLSNINSMSIAAKRHWQPGQKPVCEVESIALPADVTHCLVVDDVISSGGTMCAVRHFIPTEVECWAVSQTSQRIGSNRNKKLSPFHRVVTGVELAGHKVAYVPINSVSTLCTNPQLAESYAERNVPPEKRCDFLKLLG